MEAYLTKSDKADKKFKVKITEGNKVKTIHFGNKGSLDFTSGKRTEQERLNYLKRHSVREDFNNIFSAGAWSANALWNKKTLQSSLKDMEKKFKLKIKTKSIN